MFDHHVLTFTFTGFSDELGFPGSVGVCTPVPTFTTFSIHHLCCVGLCHGGVQDVLPAQSHQTYWLLLQLHCCEYASLHVHHLDTSITLTFLLTHFSFCISGSDTFQQLRPGSCSEGKHGGAAQEVYSLHWARRPCLLVWSTAEVWGQDTPLSQGTVAHLSTWCFWNHNHHTKQFFHSVI